MRFAALFFLSGAAGLGYQMAWTRLFTAGLGHEVPALVSVMAAFLGGMAIGAWTLGRRLAALPAARGLALLELAIGAWGCASAWFVPAINDLALQLLGAQPAPAWHWAVVFFVPFLTLLPSTMAIGATLPAMERLYRPFAPHRRGVGTVYFVNTSGAVIGTLAATFFLMPALGIRGALIAFALVNIAIGLFLLRQGPATESGAEATGGPTRPHRLPRPGTRRNRGEAPTHPASGEESSTGAGAREPGGISRRRLHATAAACGFLGIGYELIVVRGLAQVLENTAYTYACVLAVFLAGTALGGAVYQRWLSAGRRLANGQAPTASPTRTLNRLLTGLSVAILGSGWVLRSTFDIHQALREHWSNTFGAVVFGELAVAAAVLLPPTVLMGCVFSMLMQAAAGAEGETATSRLVVWNTLGCGVAAVLVTLWLLPELGLRTALVATALGYLPLLKPAWRTEAWQPVVSLGIAAVFPGIQLTRVPEGAELIAQREGILATTTVVKTPDGHRTLRVNNRLQMGGTASAIAQQREAHLPLLLHPAPHSALFLGPGTGITLGAALAHRDLQVTGVELLPEVIALMPHFEPENRGPFPKPGVRLIAADARRFIRTDTHRYDVIVADLFHPSQDGAGFLYTRDHFEAIRRRLNEGGLFCQWLPLHQLDTPTFQVITRTFLNVFSETRAVLLHFNADIPVLGLIGARNGEEPDPGRLDQRLADTELRAALRGVGLDKTIHVLGCLAAGPKFLREFARGPEIATDLNPVVLFLAPRASARRNIPAYRTLENWLDQSAGAAADLAATPAVGRDPVFAKTFGDFLPARDTYLRGLIREIDGDLTGAIDLYLESTRRSLYFTPSYARLVTVIQVMAAAERERAITLWRRLEQARPDQPLGRRLLGPLLGTNTVEAVP